jgi:uncharacterized protein YifN (PemK superfamily)
MAIDFHPHAGSVLVCDFSGFVAPEMTKMRPVIVITPRLPHRSGIATIVPISSTAPIHEHGYCVKLSKNYHPTEQVIVDTWEKCDMVMNVGLARLTSFKVGRRRYITPRLTAADLQAVRNGVLWGLGLQALIPP